MKSLILAGGRSRRMGRDKAGIERPDGIRQLDHLIALARSVTEDVVLSTNDPQLAPDGIPTLPDLHPGSGPLAALEAFHAAHPTEPVLLLGCDLFLLDAETVRHLIAGRDPSATATCFTNRIDGRPEPLCAIFEPGSLEHVADVVARQKLCARHFLEALDPAVLELPNPVALDNANTPADLDEAFAKLRHGASSKPVKILYFAKLREARGLDEESVETLACTAGGLYEELRFRHRLPLELDALRCAKNGDFCDWSTLIEPDDEIVFIPPVAGG
ncbi:NTP transferase domain-containing protein [Haloferula sargassicola]|uniref:Molybdenum cofactor guanylyltransferase n=1 Tax=Haloferula sargassicola TaxID=490096 RepID=A0ABP9UVH1_9BACT